MIGRTTSASTVMKMSSVAWSAKNVCGVRASFIMSTMRATNAITATSRLARISVAVVSSANAHHTGFR